MKNADKIKITTRRLQILNNVQYLNKVDFH